MPKKDEPENKNSFIEFVKKLWLPIAGFISAVLLIYQLLQIWKGDTQTVTWVVAVAALAVLLIFLIWFSFFAKSTKSGQWAARGGLISTIVALIAILAYRQHQQQVVAQQNQNTVIVVIAQFDGPEETYHLRDEILEQLNKSLQGDQDIKIIPVNETVTVPQGSDYARQLGKQYQADLVFWGWYGPTENPNLTLHIENLSLAKFIVFQESKTYKPQASISDLKSFSLQQEIGQQTSALISFLSGILFYKRQNYELATERFQQALDQPEWSSEMLNQGDTYFYLANCNLFSGKYQEAIVNYDKAIQINPQFADAYYNRGLSYAYQGQNAQAIPSYTQAIQINPQYVYAYGNRGISYYIQKQYSQAIEDFTQVIRFEPQDFDYIRLARSCLC